MKPSDIVLVDYEATCAAGTGMQAFSAALAEQQSGLVPNNVPGSDLATFVGSVLGIDDIEWSAEDQLWESRNNALIRLGLRQGSLLSSLEKLKAQFKNERIGVIMGSSTSSIDRAERAYHELNGDTLSPEFIQEDVLNPHAPGLFAAHECGLRGPSLTVNTACSSSAKVFASAARWLQLGLVDAVLVGGADTLCLSVLHGFHSLQLVSPSPCRPFDNDRDGINLGEAAGFALLARKEDISEHSGIVLSGYGESSDAHHMSHPHPDGLGAAHAIDDALKRAQLSPADIDYINLHGTASQANDNIEGNLVGQKFPPTTIASSTKGWMGHTLGAAGIIEALVAINALKTGLIPGTLNLSQVDEKIALKMTAKNQTKSCRHVMSNSFGFGGNNSCLIFSAVEGAA